MHLSYPRLGGAAATELLMLLTDAEPQDRIGIASGFTGRASAYATPIALASDEHLALVRAKVLEHARNCGFPLTPPASGFDDALPALLREVLSMSPADGGVAEVWNYITLVLLPDVALWRWPNSARNPSYERLIGKPRNVFRRHWWRGELLGPDLASGLNEDELVQVVERSATLGGDPRVARAVATEFRRFVATRVKDDGVRQSPLKRMELMRATAKRTLRLGRVVVLSTLTDAELAVLATELLESAATAQLSDGQCLVSTHRPEQAAVTAPPPPDLGDAPENDPEKTLNQDLVRLYERAEEELGVNGAPLRRLLTDFGGLEAAQSVLRNPPGQWYREMAAHQRLDLTVESVIVKPEVRDLFSNDDIAKAMRRLFDIGETTADPEPLQQGASGTERDSQVEDGLPPRPVLERKLQRAMVAIYEECKAELGYNATAFIRLVSDIGAVETARRLVNSATPSDGFMLLYEKGRLDLSVEALVLEPEYASLFDEATLERAEGRLREFG